MQKQQNMSWAEKQKELDRESREAVAEWDRMALERKIAALPEATRRIHEEFKHDPTRCRCFGLPRED